MTWITPPEPTEKLLAFFRRARPHGPGWKPVASVAGVPPAPGSLARDLTHALLGCVLVYAATSATTVPRTS